MTFTTTILGALVLAERRQIAFVKNSRTVSSANGFDSSSVVDSISEYYSADTTNRTADVGRYCAYIFPGFMGKGQGTGSKPSLGPLNDLRQCVGPDGVITDFGNVGWRRWQRGNRLGIVRCGPQETCKLARQASGREPCEGDTWSS